MHGTSWVLLFHKQLEGHHLLLVSNYWIPNIINNANLLFLFLVPSGAPTNVALTAVSYQQIDVSWGINARTVNGQLRSFNIQYYTAGFSNTVVYSLINSTRPYQMSLTGLAANTIYDVRVSIVNSVGEGMQSSAATANTLPKCK